MTVSFFKALIDLVKIITADWETLTFSGKLDGKLTDSGENILRKKFSVLNKKPQAILKASSSYSEILKLRDIHLL